MWLWLVNMGHKPNVPASLNINLLMLTYATAAVHKTGARTTRGCPPDEPEIPHRTRPRLSPCLLLGAAAPSLLVLRPPSRDFP